MRVGHWSILADMKARTLALLVVAAVAGVAAAYGVASRGPLRRAGADADYYCYEVKRAWVCAYARAECEARLEREVTTEIQKRCTPHTNDGLSP